MKSERWWACYSFGQHVVHVESEAEGLATNLRGFQLNHPVDYVPLAVFGSESEAREFLRGVQSLRNQREPSGGERWN